MADPGPATDALYRLRTHKIYKWLHRALKKHIVPALFAVVFVWLGLTFSSHVLYNLQDFWGCVCRESETRRNNFV